MSFLEDFTGNFIDIPGVEFFLVIQVAKQHQAIADRIDAAGNTACGLEDCQEAIWGENGILIGASAFESVLDITARFVHIHRPNVAR